jgi:hypothetical protein
MSGPHNPTTFELGGPGSFFLTVRHYIENYLLVILKVISIAAKKIGYRNIYMLHKIHLSSTHNIISKT